MCLAVPGKILSISGDGMMRTARVDFGGVIRDASLAYLPDAVAGDYVLIHVGFAISKVEESEAQRVFEYLREMDELAGLTPDSPGATRR